MARIVIRSSALMEQQYIAAGLVDDRVTFLDVKRALRLKRNLVKTAVVPPYANAGLAVAPLFKDDPRIPNTWNDLHPAAVTAICQHFLCTSLSAHPS